MATFLTLSEALAYLEAQARPNDLLIEHDIFSGRYTVTCYS